MDLVTQPPTSEQPESLLPPSNLQSTIPNDSHSLGGASFGFSHPSFLPQNAPTIDYYTGANTFFMDATAPQVYDYGCFGIQSTFSHGSNFPYLPCLDTRHPSIASVSTSMTLPSLVFSTPSLNQQQVTTQPSYLNPLQGKFYNLIQTCSDFVSNNFVAK